MSEQAENAGTSESRRSGRALNEVLRKDAFQGKPDRTMPEAVEKYYHKDGNAFRSAQFPEKIEFVDRGDRMHAYNPVTFFTARTMAETAEARGWKELEVTGNKVFQSQVYVEAKVRGIEVRGYEPTERDVDAVQRRADLKVARADPAAQAFLNAESKADRDKAMKQFPQLKDAFAADAAGKAFAAQHDSKKTETALIARNRDNIAIAVSKGLEIKVDLKDRNASAQDKAQDRDASR